MERPDMKIRWLCVFALGLGSTCASTLCGATPAETWRQLLADSWETQMVESPLFATRTGDLRFNDQLGKVSVGDAKRRHEMQLRFRERANAIDPTELSPSDQTNYAIWMRLLNDGVAEHEFNAHLIPITNRYGFHIAFAELPKRVPLKSKKHYEDYIARLSAFGNYADEHIKVLEAGIKAGHTLPAVVLEGYEDSITAHIVEDADSSLLFAPFQDFPESISDADRETLTEAGKKAIVESVVPGYERFLKFMTSQYIPSCRTSIGASGLPNGREFYRHRVRRFTTLDMTPEEIHELGQSEVRRIRNEMKQIIRDVKFKGDFAAFLDHLRNDPKFYAESAEQLMRETALVLKKMDGKLPALFKTMPRMPYGIRPVPDYIAPKTTAAYYMQPSGDGTQAGFYYVNTFNLKSRPLYNVEALSLHEAVPGHHLQIALQQELTDLPNFRRYASVTAFIEGWALYAERLGLETGFYKDPYTDFGRLTYEMWRACRLVVDSGIHYLGWTRDQSIEFMATNSGLALHNIRSEVDRYISWPGQALAYKVGELKIRELRKKAEDELQDKFDIREFHDVVLLAGAIPLDVLEDRVAEYIKSQK